MCFDFFPTLTCGVFVFSVVSAPPPPPPPASRTNQLPPTNCHQQIVINQLSTTNCHQRIVTNQLPPTNCHQPFVTNQLSSTKCYPPLVINQLPPTNCHTTSCQQPIVINSPTNCHQPHCHQPNVTNQFPPTNCHQPIVINQLSPTNYDLLANCLLQGGGMYALALAGAGGSPPLFRCDLRARCSKTLCFTGFCGHPDVHNRIFLVMGPCQHKWCKM